MVGASGTVVGVTALLVAEEMLVPYAFVAVTVNVYAMPFESPVIIIGDDPPVAVNPPTFEVTVYVVIGEPPTSAGGVKVIVACPLPAAATIVVGAFGAD